MAEAVLVNDDISLGQELIRALDGANFPVTAAAWIYYADVGEWRLVIRTPRAEKDLQSAYLDVAIAMDKKGDLRSRLDLSRVRLVPPNDRLLQAMGTALRVEGLGNVRFTQNVINGIYIDDAVVYRLAA
jgi:hypothetical protein